MSGCAARHACCQGVQKCLCNDPGLRRRYSEQALADRQRLAQAVTQAGMDALELSTQENLTDALLRFVQLRQLKPRHG